MKVLTWCYCGLVFGHGPAMVARGGDTARARYVAYYFCRSGGSKIGILIGCVFVKKLHINRAFKEI
jgi:hypothetical protein